MFGCTKAPSFVCGVLLCAKNHHFVKNKNLVVNELNHMEDSMLAK